MKTWAKAEYTEDEVSEHEAADNGDALLTIATAEDALASQHISTRRSPAFQFYPDDFLSDANVILMAMPERGIYITLICLCWQQGSIPSDVATLARYCGMTVQAFRKLWPTIERCFRPTSKPELLTHPRLDRERKKQADYRRRQSDAGKASAANRGNRGSTVVQPPFNHRSTSLVEPEGNQSPTSLVQPEGNSSSSISDLQSSDFRQQERVRAREQPIAVKPNGTKQAHVALHPSDDSALSERAGRFCERYADMHEKFRKGAKLVKAPAFRSALGAGNMDYQEALMLVATWDDARLDVLAEAFLKTEDDAWIDSGPRTLARFRSRASWCDERLRDYDARKGNGRS